MTREGKICKDAQKGEADLARIKVTSVADVTTSSVTYDSSSPSIDVSTREAKSIAYAHYRLNPGDLSTDDLSAIEQDCKITTAETIGKKFQYPSASKKTTSCQEVNLAVLDEAINMVTQATRDRYRRILKPIVPGPDNVYNTGVTWKAGDFQFEEKGDKIEVVSPRLTSLGEQLCKYLSLDRVIEYMMTDGLPAFDACP